MIISKKYELVEGCYRASIYKDGELCTIYVHAYENNNYVVFSVSFWHSTNLRLHGRVYPMKHHDTFDEILDAYIQEVYDFYRKKA